MLDEVCRRTEALCASLRRASLPAEAVARLEASRAGAERRGDAGRRSNH